MSESFLHYVWQFQYFHKYEFCTSDGDPIHVFHTGYHNHHAGPDFHTARIRIGDVEWAGSVEIHIKSSSWYDHHHDHDVAYDNVILHVVWINDKPVLRQDGTALPVLELKDRVDIRLLSKYNDLVNTIAMIPCASQFQKMSSITLYSMLDKALSVRLERKGEQVSTMLAGNQGDWEETCYQLLGKNFGFKVNAEPFLQLTLSLPYKIVMKHADKREHVEALMLGSAGFLEGTKQRDSYTEYLSREFKLLSTKYGLDNRKLSGAQWKFLRLRPANFPTVRISQLAAILQEQKNIFSRIIEADSLTDVMEIFSYQQAEYWKNHYRLGKPSEDVVAPLGEMSMYNIIINTVVPLLVAYAKAKDDDVYTERAIALLQAIPAEENSLLRHWQSLQVKSKTAFDSQALIELLTGFCSKRRCLDCNIGVALIKPGPE